MQPIDLTHLKSVLSLQDDFIDWPSLFAAAATLNEKSVKDKEQGPIKMSLMDWMNEDEGGHMWMLPVIFALPGLFMAAAGLFAAAACFIPFVLFLPALSCMIARSRNKKAAKNHTLPVEFIKPSPIKYHAIAQADEDSGQLYADVYKTIPVLASDNTLSQEETLITRVSLSDANLHSNVDAFTELLQILKDAERPGHERLQKMLKQTGLADDQYDETYDAFLTVLAEKREVHALNSGIAESLNNHASMLDKVGDIAEPAALTATSTS